MVDIAKLNNGITLITDTIKEVESVSIKIVVNTGARNETKDNTGISHFIEHMAFKGTEKRTAKQISFDLENIGASFNAYTSKESTCYYAKVLKEYTEQAFEILVDMIENSIFSEEEVEKERDVILQELAMTNDTPDDVVFDYFTETAFPNQQVGRTILGPAENIKKFQKDDFVKYIKKNYTSENIVVSICGNIEPDQAKDIGNKYFKKIISGEKREVEKGEYKGGYFKKVKKDLEQFQCIVGFNGISYHDEYFFDLSVGNFIFGGSMSSRLFQEIREKQGLCYTVFSGNTALSDCGTFKIYVGTEPNKVNQAIDGIITETKRFIDDGITDEELQRAKVKIKSSVLMANESVSARASAYANDYIKYGKIYTLQEISDLIDKVDKKRIKEVFEKMYNSPVTVALYGSNDNVYDYETIKNKVK